MKNITGILILPFAMALVVLMLIWMQIKYFLFERLDRDVFDIHFELIKEKR